MPESLGRGSAFRRFTEPTFGGRDTRDEEA
jgi:hypothetical protein